MEKIRYIISDAAKEVNVEAHVLRYWEEELDLEIPRNEMGHRYYTEDNIIQFKSIKDLKEQGYQLRAIKMIVHNTDTKTEISKEEIVKPEIVKPEIAKIEGKPSPITADKMQQFQMIMSKIVKTAIEENNQAIGKEVGNHIGERVIKEVDYLFRLQDEQEEERFKRLDETIRTHQRMREEIAQKEELEIVQKKKKRFFSKASKSKKMKAETAL